LATSNQEMLVTHARDFYSGWGDCAKALGRAAVGDSDCSTITALGQAHIRETCAAAGRARAIEKFAAGSGRAALATIDDTATAYAAIDRNRTTTPRAEDIRHELSSTDSFREGQCRPSAGGRITLGGLPISFAWPCGGACGHEGFAADSSHFRTRRFPIGRAVPGPWLVVFEVRAHHPNVERSRRFNGVLRDFLRGRLVDDAAGAAHAAIG
jgi:hypothetical protein